MPAFSLICVSEEAAIDLMMEIEALAEKSGVFLPEAFLEEPNATRS